MNYIIDVQGFHDAQGMFMAKEVAVVAVDHYAFAHWVVAPPYPFSELSSRERGRNNWLTLMHHGIEWFEGDVTHKQLNANLRDVARTARNIFTRGSQKENFLREVMSREIINLERVECPSFRKLPDDVGSCLLHSGHRKEFSCALNRALKVKKWFETCGLSSKDISAIPFDIGRAKSATTPAKKFDSKDDSVNVYTPFDVSGSFDVCGRIENCNVDNCSHDLPFQDCRDDLCAAL